MDGHQDNRNVCRHCGTTLTGTKEESGWDEKFITYEYKWSKGEWVLEKETEGDCDWTTEECFISISCPNSSCPVEGLPIDENGDPEDQEEWDAAINQDNAIAEEEAE